MELSALKNLGLTDEQAKSVKDLFSKELDGNYVPKAKFDGELQKVKDKETQIAERDKQISELSKFKGDTEAFQKQIAELVAKNEASEKEYATKLKEVELKSALQMALSDKVYDFNDVFDKLDVSKVVIQEGKVVAGLDDQVAEMQKSHPHYFRAEDDGKGYHNFGRTPRDGTDPKEPTIEDYIKNLAKKQGESGPLQKQISETYFGE